MSSAPLPSSEPRKPISLAKLATIFAVIFGLAFGLCSVSVISASSRGSGGGVTGFLIPTAIVIEAVCAIGLLVIAVLAIVRSARRKE
jgi:hypothetical protein